MRRRTQVSLAVAAVAAASTVAFAGAAHAGGDNEGGVSGKQADDATAAALKATGGGHANSVEQDTENGATWEVEVTKPDGNTVDVRLDDGYQVVVIESDSEQR